MHSLSASNKYTSGVKLLGQTSRHISFLFSFLLLFGSCFSSQVPEVAAVRRPGHRRLHRRLALSAASHHRPAVSHPIGRPDLPHVLQLHLQPRAPAAFVRPASGGRREEGGGAGGAAGGRRPAGDHPSGVHQGQLPPVHAELAHLAAAGGGRELTDAAAERLIGFGINVRPFWTSFAAPSSLFRNVRPPCWGQLAR